MRLDRDFVFKIRKAISAKNCNFMTAEDKIAALEVILDCLSPKEKRDISMRLHLIAVGR